MNVDGQYGQGGQESERRKIIKHQDIFLDKTLAIWYGFPYTYSIRVSNLMYLRQITCNLSRSNQY